MPDLVWNFAAVIVGGLVTVMVTAYFANRQEMEKIRIETTLHLFAQYQSNEMVTSRNQANKILRENKTREHPFSYGELYLQLPSDQYDHIARILQFFTQVALLHRSKYLDRKLVQASLGKYFEFWHNEHFDMLWRISKEKGEPPREWVEPMAYLAKEMKLTHNNPAQPESQDA